MNICHCADLEDGQTLLICCAQSGNGGTQARRLPPHSLCTRLCCDAKSSGEQLQETYALQNSHFLWRTATFSCFLHTYWFHPFALYTFKIYNVQILYAYYATYLISIFCMGMKINPSGFSKCAKLTPKISRWIQGRASWRWFGSEKIWQNNSIIVLFLLSQFARIENSVRVRKDE